MRTERDSLGSVRVPGDVYYGAQTQRSVGNFSGTPPKATLIHAYALVKQAAARANMRLKRLDTRRGQAIVKAAREVMSGKWSTTLFHSDLTCSPGRHF